jgi:hypothetical protein
MADSISVSVSPSSVEERTRHWVERMVIGLQLCPFARKPYAAGTVRFRVSRADSPNRLRSDLVEEMQLLTREPREVIETTLLIHPWTFSDFDDFNAFLDVVDDCLRELDLEGVVQVASFHPDYLFAGSDRDDVSNATNRSPYPMLHLLREQSLSEALDRFEGDPATIPARNVALLESLGWEGVAARIRGTD